MTRRRLHTPALDGLSLFAGELPPRACEGLPAAAAWLADVQLGWRQLAPCIAFAADGYLRQRLLLERGWEVVLCSWLPGQASPVHGHGRSVGAVRVIAGALHETCFEAREGRVAPTLTRRISTGGVLLEENGTLHRVANRGSAPALSLHLYAPPLDG